VKLYEKIPAVSKHRLTALLEQSWSLFQAGDHKLALRNLRQVTVSPAHPEAHLLKAVITYQNCRYKESLAVIRGFDARFAPLGTKLQALMKRYRDTTDLYSYALKVQKRRRPGTLVARAVRAVIDDRRTQKYFDYNKELERELRLVHAAPATWKANAVAGIVLQDLTLQRSLAQSEAGTLVKHRILRLVRELESLQKQAQKVRAEAKVALASGKRPAGCDRLGAP
jgi:hypothetical protein